MLILIFLMFQ